MDCVLRVLAVLLVLTVDEAQFAPQALAVAQQVAVVFQQPAVLLDESGCSLLLPLVLLQLTHQLLSKPHTASVTASWTQKWVITDPSTCTSLD